jgi:hypothetical protein
MGVPWRMIVEEDQLEDYSREFNPANLVVLDPLYKQNFDAFWDFPEGSSLGSGPARNFIWDLAASEGHKFHWIMDDNIHGFGRVHENQRIPVGDGFAFVAMEDFVQRYKNIAMAGPNYFMFLPSRNKRPPFTLNTRIFSCNLIRTDLPFRWRGRYNEDLDLSLRILKDGWATVLFNAFYQWKMPTQIMSGGNTEAFYSNEGTLPKSKMAVQMHPDVTKISYKFSRWHHHVDFSGFKQALVRDPDYTPKDLSSVKLKREPRTNKVSMRGIK